jgi:hypothetical protein
MSSSHKPPKKRRTAQRREADEQHERPTVNPPFDVAAYARATAVSEAPHGLVSKDGTSLRLTTPPSADVPSSRSTTPPSADGSAGAWSTPGGRDDERTSAVTPQRDRSSKQARPPSRAPGAPRAIAAKKSWSEFPLEEPVSKQITLTNELELEQARARSEPPKRLSGGALAIANARAPSAIPPAGNLPPTVSGVEIRPRSGGADGTSAEGGVVKRGGGTSAEGGVVKRGGGTSAEGGVVKRGGGTSAEGGVVKRGGGTSAEGGVVKRGGGTLAPEITEGAIEDPVEEMRERFSLGDYSGALEMSELILAQDPANLDAAECGENCRSVLESMYAARLGPLDRVPIVIVPNAQMRWLSMDHRAGFILSLIDGSSTVEMILDVSSMPRLDALRIMLDLAQQKIVSFDETREKPDRHNLEKTKRK